MIIAVDPGIEISDFIEKIPNTVKVQRESYLWMIPKTEETSDWNKNLPCCISDPLYPWNYAADILKFNEIYDYVLIPDNKIFVFFNVEYHVPIIQVSPYVENRGIHAQSEINFPRFKLEQGRHLLEIKDQIDDLKEDICKCKLDPEGVSGLHFWLGEMKTGKMEVHILNSEGVIVTCFDMDYGEDLKNIVYCLGKSLSKLGYEIEIETEGSYD